MVHLIVYVLCRIVLLKKTSLFIRYLLFIERLSLLIYLSLIKSFIIYFKTFTVMINRPLSMLLYSLYGFWPSSPYVLKIFRSLPILLLSPFILYYSLFVMYSFFQRFYIIIEWIIWSLFDKGVILSPFDKGVI